MTLYSRSLATLLSVLAVSTFISLASAGDGCGQKDCDQKGCDQKGCGSIGGHGLGLGICADCACQRGCNQVCRLVEKPLDKEITCYKCDCETVCLPGPTKRGCRHVDYVSCDGDKCGDDKGCGGCGQKGCGSCGSHARDVKVVWYDWITGGKGKGGDCGGGIGGCRRSRTVKKLMKKTVEADIKCAKSYEWEVVDLCKGCEQKAEKKAAEMQLDADAEVPPPPPVEARILNGRPIVERMVSQVR